VVLLCGSVVTAVGKYAPGVESPATASASHRHTVDDMDHRHTVTVDEMDHDAGGASGDTTDEPTLSRKCLLSLWRVLVDYISRQV
jgi:hypothetical protein